MSMSLKHVTLSLLLGAASVVFAMDDVILTAGAMEHIRCVSEIPPDFSAIWWYKLDQDLHQINPPVAQYNGSLDQIDDRFKIVQPATLRISPVITEHEGCYRCIITTSSSARIVREYNISIDEAGVFPSVNLLAGTKDVVPCIRRRQLDLLSVEWYKAGKRNDSGDQHTKLVGKFDPEEARVPIAGVQVLTNTSLSIDNVIPNHAGSYRCVVKKNGSSYQTELKVNVLVDEAAIWAKHITLTLGFLSVIIPLTCAGYKRKVLDDGRGTTTNIQG